MEYPMTKDGQNFFLDMHTHIGVAGHYNMPPEMLLQSMEDYHIPFAIISNIACGETLSASENGEDLQLKYNREAIALAHEHPDRLAVLLWCRPNKAKGGEGFNQAFEQLYTENRDVVKGLKLHPDISALSALDEQMEPYLQMAEKYDLPVLFHTSPSVNSRISNIVALAKKHPKIIFILGHLSLCSDCQEALAAIAAYENIYGDTCWVRPEIVKQAEEMGIVHKIMFGTDNPINGAKTYDDPIYYNGLYSNQIGLSESSLQMVAHETAEKIFRLK